MCSKADGGHQTLPHPSANWSSDHGPAYISSLEFVGAGDTADISCEYSGFGREDKSETSKKILDKGPGYLRQRIFHRDSGFDRLLGVADHHHVSAVESLRQTRQSSADMSNALPIEVRTAGKKRLLSGQQRDDSYNGGERQRHCFSGGGGTIRRPDLTRSSSTVTTQQHQQQQLQSLQSVTPPPAVAAAIDDVFISHHLSLGVERMDLHSDGGQRSSNPVLPALPNWIPTSNAAPLQTVCDSKTSADNFCAQSSSTIGAVDFIKPFSSVATSNGSLSCGGAPVALPRSGSRRCRKTISVGRVGSGGWSSRPGFVNRNRKSDYSRLESFFDKMGMDQGAVRSSTFENVSSIGGTSTVDSHTSYAGSADRMHETFFDTLDQVDININDRETLGSSVVERNARIIKWLYSIKKASADGDAELDDGFV